jgi:mono/diheme cytochrome c family protein
LVETRAPMAAADADFPSRLAAFLTLFDHNRLWEVVVGRRPLSNMTRGLFTLGAMCALIAGAAQAQNLDQGKSGARLFADGCAACHRSARDLAKGRFSLTLFLFLQDHYASNSSSAWALTSYLESIDSAPHGGSKTTAAKPSAVVARTSRSSPRPPMPVPER